MKRKFHVRFCTGGGVGNHPTARIWWGAVQETGFADRLGGLQGKERAHDCTTAYSGAGEGAAAAAMEVKWFCWAMRNMIRQRCWSGWKPTRNWQYVLRTSPQIYVQEGQNSQPIGAYPLAKGQLFHRHASRLHTRRHRIAQSDWLVGQSLRRAHLSGNQCAQCLSSLSFLSASLSNRNLLL